MGFCLFFVVEIDGFRGDFGVTRTEPTRPTELFCCYNYNKSLNFAQKRKKIPRYMFCARSVLLLKVSVQIC